MLQAPLPWPCGLLPPRSSGGSAMRRLAGARSAANCRTFTPWWHPLSTSCVRHGGIWGKSTPRKVTSHRSLFCVKFLIGEDQSQLAVFTINVATVLLRPPFVEILPGLEISVHIMLSVQPFHILHALPVLDDGPLPVFRHNRPSLPLSLAILRFGQRAINASDPSESLVVKLAVMQVVVPNELPHLLITPVNDRADNKPLLVVVVSKLAPHHLPSVAFGGANTKNASSAITAIFLEYLATPSHSSSWWRFVDAGNHCHHIHRWPVPVRVWMFRLQKTNEFRRIDGCEIILKVKRYTSHLREFLNYDGILSGAKREIVTVRRFVLLKEGDSPLGNSRKRKRSYQFNVCRSESRKKCFNHNTPRLVLLRETRNASPPSGEIERRNGA